MARIQALNDNVIMSIRAFLGLNENPDGDTSLKNGELAECRNFRITPDSHLQVRPGCHTVLRLPVAAGGVKMRGAWYGTVGDAPALLCAWGGTLWSIDLDGAQATERGSCTDADTTFFGFGGKVYALTGTEYLCWDGAVTAFSPVEGYVPLVQVATTPAGAGTLLEAVNRLTDKKRVRFSPDGTADTFHLPEQGVDEVTAVLLNGAAVTGYTADLTAGTVKTPSVPAAGTDTLEITYRKGGGARSEVERMRFAELYNGATDTRVFLYGDGSNRCVYSGVEYDSGQPSAEYFPDLYEVAVGTENTPLTALVRHYDRLMAYKTDSAWVIRYGTLTLEDGTGTAAFYCQSVNRQFGNDAPGQVHLLENSPVTIDTGSLFRWQTSGYSAYISSSENNAKRISDRVASTLAGFDSGEVRAFNCKRQHEYWILHGNGTALILNYAVDAWYKYTALPFRLLLEVERERIGFCDDGRVVRFSRAYRSDDGEAIDCRAATGSMDFGRDWLRKYSPMLFVALMPESGAKLTVSVESNLRSDYPEKVLSYDLASFSHMDFGRYTFFTNRKPQTARLPIKVKKATFYKLVFHSNDTSSTATVIEADVRVRYGSFVR